MSFQIGEQVVCVDPNPEWGRRGPLKGKTYTIASVGLCLGEPVITVNETSLMTWCNKCFGDHHYYSRRFRPVRKTFISIFTAMLSPTPKKEKVKA